MKIVNVEKSPSTTKKSVESKKVDSKQHTSPKQLSPVATTVSTDTAIEFSPRRSSRARRATEKGKNIFDIFESKVTQNVRTDAEKIVQKSPAAKEIVVEHRTRRGKATEEKPHLESAKGEDQKENFELETIGRHTRSKIKVVTKKVEIKQADENENKKGGEKRESFHTRKNRKEEREQKNDLEKVGSNQRVTRSGRKIESTPVKEEQVRISYKM